jgi:hypothetical protein
MPNLQTAFISLLFCLMATFATQYLQSFSIRQTKIGKIKSASIVTLILGLIIQMIPVKLFSSDVTHMQLLILGSTFVGMADRKTFSPLFMAFICGLFYFAFENLHVYFSGPKAPGGVLGFFAFLSSLLFWGIDKIKSRQHID